MTRSSSSQFYDVLNGSRMSFCPRKILGGNVAATGLTDSTLLDSRDAVKQKRDPVRVSEMPCTNFESLENIDEEMNKEQRPAQPQ